MSLHFKVFITVATLTVFGQCVCLTFRVDPKWIPATFVPDLIVGLWMLWGGQ